MRKKRTNEWKNHTKRRVVVIVSSLLICVRRIIYEPEIINAFNNRIVYGFTSLGRVQNDVIS